MPIVIHSSLKNFNCQIKAVPINAGKAKLIIHTTIEADTTAFTSLVTVLKTEEALLTAISVSAKVGMAVLTKKVKDINRNEFNNPTSILKSNKMR